MNTQQINLDPLDLRLPTNLRMVLIGASQAGKSSFMKSLMTFKNQIFRQPYQKFVYCSPSVGESMASERDRHFEEELRKAGTCWYFILQSYFEWRWTISRSFHGWQCEMSGFYRWFPVRNLLWSFIMSNFYKVFKPSQHWHMYCLPSSSGFKV